MAVKTWTQTSGNLWSTAANWSGGTVPVDGDSVVFDNTSDANCTIDNLGTFNDNVSINSGYDGVITQGSGVNISWGTFSQAAGTFTCASDATYTCTTFSVTGGTFNQGGAFTSTTFGCTSNGIYVGSSATMSTTTVTFSGTSNLTATSGTWSINGSMTKTNSPTWSANSGTLRFTGNGNIDMSGLTLNLVQIAATGTITVSSGTTAPLGANPTTSTGGSNGITINGTVTASGTWNQTGQAGANAIAINVLSSGTISGALTDVVITNGGWQAASSTTIPSGLNITITTGFACSFAGGGKTYGTVRIIPSASVAVSFTGSNTFSTLRCNDGSFAMTLTFTAATTQTISTFSVAGASGKPVTLRSATVGSAWVLTTASGAKTASHCIIQDSTVDASPTWTADSNSANGGGNTNWLGFFVGGGGSGGGGSRGRVRQSS